MLPFPVWTQEKLCIISKRPIYANIPRRALCFSRPFLSRFLVGCLSLLLDTAVSIGGCPFSLVLRSVLPHKYDRSDKLFANRHVAPLKFVFAIVFDVMLSALLHGGWRFCSHPRCCFCNCSNIVELFTVLLCTPYK